MTHRFHLVALATLGVLCLGLAGPAQASFITNGSFESASVDPGGGFATLGSGSTAITGWTVGGAGVDYIGGFWQAGQGSRSLDMSAADAGSISQTLSGLTVGSSYQVSFLMAGNTGGGNTLKTLTASVGSFNQDFTFDTTGKSTQNMGWTSMSFLFTAASTAPTLTFTSQEHNAFGPALDDVSVTTKPTPEPGSFALLGLGASGVVLAAWRRKKTA